MKIINLSENNSVLNQFLKEIRSTEIQKDSMRFRKNMERIGEIMAYEISKAMKYDLESIQTPLGIASINILQEKVVVSTILRAGLPFHYGFLNYFDQAENGFVSAFRKYSDEINFEIVAEYLTSPDLTNKTLIITDPMLATGSSMELAYHALLTKGKPSKVHIATVVATEKALEYLSVKFQDIDISLWTAAVDPHLNAHSYIVPGLGDAGDLAFGEKI